MTLPAKLLSALLVLVGLLCLPGVALAHDAFPLVVTLRQVGDNVYSAELKLPPSVPDQYAPSLQMPAGCQRLTKGPAESVRGLYRCKIGLGGQALHLAYPASIPSVPGLVRISWLSGESRSVLLEPGATSATLPMPESASAVAGVYLRMGVEHILFGYDHLLFLVCLLWIAGTARRILITITGFTLAHSVTLALSVLEIVRIPIAPVEAAIALSIVFLAVEIFKGRRDTLTWRYPIAVSSSFGLLHGLGFAAALRSIGLPQTELVTGLLFFNLGVELGQLAFVLAAISLYLPLRRLRAAWFADIANNTTIRHVSSAFVGVLASYWLIERIAAFLV